MRKPYIRNDIYPSVSRYNYPIKKFAGIDAYSKEDSLALNYGKYGYNIGICNGILTNGMGISEASNEENSFPAFQDQNKKILKMFFYKHFDYENNCQDDRLIILADDTYIYQARLTDERFNIISGMRVVSNKASFCNYNYNGDDCLICAGGRNNEFVIYNGTTVSSIAFLNVLKDICVHKERIFGVDEDGIKLYFSAALDPTNWNESLTEGGHIDLADGSGTIKKLVSFKDALYIFKEYSIYKLNVYGNQTEFNLSKVFESNNLIYSDSACVCNNTIIFMADDGFYTFDGYNCNKILKGIYPLVNCKKNVKGCYFNHKYYLTCNLFVDENVFGDETYYTEDLCNNGIISYELNSGDIEIFRGSDILDFVPVSINEVNRLFVYFNSPNRTYKIGQIDETGKLFEQTLPKKWQSVVTDFELLDKDKVLRRIYLKTSSNLTLIARIDEDYTYNVTGVLGKNALIIVNKRADQIGLTIQTTEENFLIRGILLEFDLIRRKNNE